VLRFLVIGGANTLATTLAFYLLAHVLPPRVAFTIVYVAGLAFVVLVTPGYVFGSSSSWRRRVLLALWYVGTYLVGIGVISLLTSVASASRIVIVLGTVAVTAPLGFVGARLLVGRRQEGSGASAGGSAPSG
jgi:putative flippase GtrA